LIIFYITLIDLKINSNCLKLIIGETKRSRMFFAHLLAVELHPNLSFSNRKSSIIFLQGITGKFKVRLNQFWGLEGCPLKGQTMLTNRSVRFGFCGATVLVACRGDQVSFYTTEGHII
jgi:hypothetical protein